MSIFQHAWEKNRNNNIADTGLRIGSRHKGLHYCQNLTKLEKNDINLNSKSMRAFLNGWSFFYSSPFLA
jgi:hypothetical protein